MSLSKPELETVLRCVDKMFDFSAERDRLSGLLATLEAENKVLAARVAELEEANRSNRVVMGGLSAVVDAWKDHCKRLEEAGDQMADWNMNERNLGCDPELADKWQQAKEDKP